MKFFGDGPAVNCPETNGDGTCFYETCSVIPNFYRLFQSLGALARSLPGLSWFCLLIAKEIPSIIAALWSAFTAEEDGL